MSSRRSFSADKQTHADIRRAMRRAVELQDSCVTRFSRHASANRGLTDNDLARERKEVSRVRGRRERTSELAEPTDRPTGRSVDPAATIYHAAVASIVLLVLRYASRREKPKRGTLSPFASEGVSNRRRRASVQHVFVSRPPSSSATASLCFYFSRSPSPLFFSFLRCVIMLLLRPL